MKPEQPILVIPSAHIFIGDNLKKLRTMKNNSVDSVVTDCPYGLGKEPDPVKVLQDWIDHGYHAIKGKGFMGNEWDAFVPQPILWREIFRVLKPGGHVLAFFGTRTYDWGVMAMRFAGFEIRDQIDWIYGTGFPKSHNLKEEWEGWGTALKPGHEPICLARKPLIGTVAENVMLHGTGAININATRIEFQSEEDLKSATWGNGTDITGGKWIAGNEENRKSLGKNIQADPLGRWPANIIHDGSEEVLSHFPNTESGKPSGTKAGNNNNVYGQFAGGIPVTGYGDNGSAARFFYCAKATKQDRDEGLEHLEDKTGGMISDTSGQHITRREEGYKPEPRKNNHPTVKPTPLMRWLVRLITPPGGIVLDPFAGSGSTGKAAILEGFDSILLELDQDKDGNPLGYKEIIEGRTRWAQKKFEEEKCAAVIRNPNKQIPLFG